MGEYMSSEWWSKRHTVLAILAALRASERDENPCDHLELEFTEHQHMSCRLSNRWGGGYLQCDELEVEEVEAVDLYNGKRFEVFQEGDMFKIYNKAKQFWFESRYESAERANQTAMWYDDYFASPVMNNSDTSTPPSTNRGKRPETDQGYFRFYAVDDKEEEIDLSKIGPNDIEIVGDE